MIVIFLLLNVVGYNTRLDLYDFATLKCIYKSIFYISYLY